MKTKLLANMTKDERSLLIFFETCAVDNSGLVDVRHMNVADIEIARKWNADRFILFGRVKFTDINPGGGNGRYTHWCNLSNKAFALAHQERFARARRLWEKKTWCTISKFEEM